MTYSPWTIYHTSFADIAATVVHEELLALDTTIVKGIDAIGPLVLKHCALALYNLYAIYLYKLLSNTESLQSGSFMQLPQSTSQVTGRRSQTIG